jgi:hypothetical protein
LTNNGPLRMDTVQALNNRWFIANMTLQRRHLITLMNSQLGVQIQGNTLVPGQHTTHIGGSYRRRRGSWRKTEIVVGKRALSKRGEVKVLVNI